MLHIKGNLEIQCSNMVENADRGTINKKHIKPDFWSKACASPLCGLRGWGQRSRLNFFRNDHVAYQIKGNYWCRNMAANIMPADPPPSQPWGKNVKIQLFHNIVMLHIKFKAIANAVTWYQIIWPQPPLPKPWGSKGQIQLLQNMVMSS